MFRYIVYTFFAGLSLLTGLSSLSKSQTEPIDLSEEQGIYTKIYNAPLRVYGESKINRINQLYQQRPLLLAFVYTRCTGICNPFLLQLKETLELTHSENNFQVLVVSFDSYDDTSTMHQAAIRFGLNNNPQWTFGVTDRIDSLNKSVQFAPAWDSIRSQFDHEALIVGINNQGYITKKLLGIRDIHDIKLMISSINNEFIPSYRLPGKNNLLSCFNYDPKTGKNTMAIGFFIIALPATITLIIILTIVLFTSKRKTL